MVVPGPKRAPPSKLLRVPQSVVTIGLSTGGVVAVEELVVGLDIGLEVVEVELAVGADEEGLVD